MVRTGDSSVDVFKFVAVNQYSFENNWYNLKYHMRSCVNTCKYLCLMSVYKIRVLKARKLE
jgi:hypothetical protein